MGGPVGVGTYHSVGLISVGGCWPSWVHRGSPSRCGYLPFYGSNLCGWVFTQLGSLWVAQWVWVPTILWVWSLWVGVDPVGFSVGHPVGVGTYHSVGLIFVGGCWPSWVLRGSPSGCGRCHNASWMTCRTSYLPPLQIKQDKRHIRCSTAWIKWAEFYFTVAPASGWFLEFLIIHTINVRNSHCLSLWWLYHFVKRLFTVGWEHVVCGCYWVDGGGVRMAGGGGGCDSPLSISSSSAFTFPWRLIMVIDCFSFSRSSGFPPSIATPAITNRKWIKPEITWEDVPTEVNFLVNIATLHRHCL